MGNDNFVAKHKVLTGVAGAVVLIFIALYMLYSKLVVWDEEPTIALKESITTAPNPTYAVQITDSASKPIPSVVVKGKISVTVKKERGLPFTDAVVVLRSEKGKSLREVQVSSQGVVVFDDVAAGTYRVETHRMGDGRIASKTITLNAGDITTVDLALYLDSEVKVTVHVKTSDGGSVANKSLTLTKAGGPTLNVTTDGSGTFTATISPDDSWKLISGDKEIGSFKVDPTGQNQTINVTASSN